jgi:hypothetical protein
MTASKPEPKDKPEEKDGADKPATQEPGWSNVDAGDPAAEGINPAPPRPGQGLPPGRPVRPGHELPETPEPKR